VKLVSAGLGGQTRQGYRILEQRPFFHHRFGDKYNVFTDKYRQWAGRLVFLKSKI